MFSWKNVNSSAGQEIPCIHFPTLAPCYMPCQSCLWFFNPTIICELYTPWASVLSPCFVTFLLRNNYSPQHLVCKQRLFCSLPESPCFIHKKRLKLIIIRLLVTTASLYKQLFGQLTVWFEYKNSFVRHLTYICFS